MEVKTLVKSDTQISISNNLNGLSGFDHSVKVTRVISRMCGVWPGFEEKKSFTERFFFIVPGMVTFFSITLPQLRRVMIHRKDLSTVLELMTTGIVMELISILKLLAIRYNQSGLRWLLRRMVDDWKIYDKGQYYKIMWVYARHTNTIVTICIALTTGNIAAQIIRQYAIYIIERHYSSANETVIKPTILKSDFYFNEQIEGIYELVVAAQILGGFSVAFSFTAFDGFFVCSIMHVSGQIHKLQMQIEDLVQCYERREGAFSEVLGPIVHRHRDLRGYAAVIEENFNKIFLVQMLVTSVFLCLQGFEFAMVVAEGGTEMVPHLIFIVCFVASNLVSIFTYCFVAEQLRTQSNQLFRSIFQIRWYDLTPKDSRLLIIIMVQTKKPIEITVGKFVPFSLDYFCSVLKTSAGYLSVLLSMKDRL
ncbi:odorant receptor 23 [Nasonia vitripennis]|uniref:Odorant receptor n=1 Tax=Nasonia vitripennis TaxID=7425 RepID=A0A7M6W5V3_NASVI|nr:odorant receptor 23 [Nasonia vitripennis]